LLPSQRQSRDLDPGDRCHSFFDFNALDLH